MNVVIKANVRIASVSAVVITVMIAGVVLIMLNVGPQSLLFSARLWLLDKAICFGPQTSRFWAMGQVAEAGSDAVDLVNNMMDSGDFERQFNGSQVAGAMLRFSGLEPERTLDSRLSVHLARLLNQEIDEGVRLQALMAAEWSNETPRIAKDRIFDLLSSSNKHEARFAARIAVWKLGEVEKPRAVIKQLLSSTNIADIRDGVSLVRRLEDPMFCREELARLMTHKSGLVREETKRCIEYIQLPSEK